jgi:hypothetical protein
MPNLILAYRDAIGGAFRIDFADSVARTVLGGVVVGRHPEYAEPGTALAWIAAGYVAAGRGHIVGPVLVQARALVAAHLPYRDARGRVGLVLSAVARSTPCCSATAGAEIIPFRRPQGG